MAEQRLEASERVDSLRSNHSMSGIEQSSRYALRKDGDKVATRKREARGKLGEILRLSVRVVGGTRRCEGSDALRTGFVRVRAVEVRCAGPAGTKQKMRFISYRTLS